MSDDNLALIGAGYWGKNLARNFHKARALRMLCDLDPKILATYGTDYAGVQKVGSVDSVWADPEITRVAIAAPAVYHHSLAKRALEAGKDVFVEKPLCLDPPDADELIKIASAHGRILMVGHLLQYHPLVQSLLALVNSGSLGDLYYITSNRLNLGKIRIEENALWSFAPHDLSVILALTGKLPDQVRCTGGTYLSAGVADTTMTTMSFCNGVRAHAYVSWLNPFKEQKLTVVCSKGMAVFDDTRPWNEKLAIYRDYLFRDGRQNPVPKKSPPEFVLVPESEPLEAECQHFIECCDNRSQPRTNGAEGLRVLRVLKAAQTSLDGDGKEQSLSNL